MEALTNFFNLLSLKLTFVVVIYVLVLLLVSLDLWSGIRKAKHRGEYKGFFRKHKQREKTSKQGEYISSYGLQKTVNKVARYFNMLFAVTVIDIMQMLAVYKMEYDNVFVFLPILPIFTFLAGIFIGIIEIKSIYERAEQKDKAKYAGAAKFIKEALKDRETKEIISNILNKIESDENN
jgi:hypothetical protein